MVKRGNLLICDFLVVCIFVFELENLLKTLHVPTWGKIIFLYFTDWQELNTVNSLKLSGKKENLHTSSGPIGLMESSISCLAAS